MGLRLFVFCLGILGFVRAQQSGSTSAIDFYTALVQVNVRCVNDQVNGLMCAAEYPDQCKEQWNFPNPCSQANIDMNVTKFVHPFDKTKFLMCGQLGKLYVVQCPQYEVFHEGCGQCVGEEAGLTASCEVPLTPQHANPCTREAILANKLFFPFPGNLSKFIHCDVWGKPWERICTPGEVWSQWDVTCVLPNLLNPCNRQTTDVNFYYKHPCDPAMYLACDAQGRAHEVDCPRGEAFHETNQRCLPYKDFKGQYLSSFCENYMFGFRKFHGNKGTAIDPSRTAETIDLGLTPDAIIQLNREGAGIKSIVSGGLLGSGQAGITIDRTKKVIGGSVSASKVTSGQGLNIDVNIGGGSVGKKTIIQGGGEGSASLDRTTQLKGGKVSGTVTTDGVSSSLDVKIGQVNVGKSGTIGLNQDITSGASSNFIDIRGKPMTTAEFIDIRRKTNDGIGANMVDIRSGPTSETKMVDIRVQQSGTQQPDIKMVDIRGSQATGSKEMVDIRGQQTGTQPMVDIRVQQSGTQQPDTKMVDIRGSQTTGSKEMVDIRGQQTGTQPMVDIRIQQSGTQQPDTTMVDIRGSQTTGSKEMVDIRGKTNDGIGANMVDIRSGPTSETKMVDIRVQQSGTQQPDTTMVDIRGSQTTGSKEMVDIRGKTNDGIGANMVDIRSGPTSETKMVDIRVQQNDAQQLDTKMVDIRGSQTTGSKEMVDIRGQLTGTQPTDPKKVDVHVQVSGEQTMVDIRGKGTGTGPINTGPSSQTGNQMVDIRTTKSPGMVDIRGSQEGTGSNAKFVDIRTSQMKETGGAFVDIRSPPTSETSTGAGFVDVRTSQTGGTGTGTGFVDIRTPQSSGTGTGTDFVDIRTTQTGETGTNTGFVDIRTSQTGETGKGTGFVDIRTPQASGTGTGAGFVDIRTSETKTGGTGTFVDIRTQQTGGSSTGTDFVDVRTPQTDGTATGTDFVDIRTAQTGGTGTGGAFVDVRTSQTGGTGTGTDFVDIRTPQSSGTGTGTDFVDIRTTQTGGTGTDGAFVDIRTSQTGGTGTGTDFVDIRTPQSSGTGTGTDFVDIRTTQTGGTGTGNTFVDIRTSPTGGTGTGTGFVDIRTPPASGTGANTAFVDIRTSQTGGTGTGTGFVDIRTQQTETGIGTGAGFVDIRAPPTSDSGIVVGPSMKTDGMGMTESTWVDIRGQGQGPDMTSGGQWTDIRALENQGQDTRGQTDISVVPSMDLRKELGISGGINTADASGRFVKNTITINSTMQGQEQGGTMQELLKAWNQIVGDNQGSRTGTDTSGFGAEISGSVMRFSTGTNNVIETPQNVPGNGKIIDSRLSVHPSQLRMYEYSEIPYSEPCIQENLDAGRTHFRYKGHPHMFLQCDGSGRMYRMPCSTVGRDWFDVYTNTCVDGPVHVDNLVSRR